MAHGVSELIKVLPAEVTFVSTCQGIEEYWIDDSEVAEGIVALMDSNIQDYVTVDRVFHDPAGFRDITQRFDFVIATRMHAGILGLTGGTPVIPIAYEFKTNELFAKLGLADYVLDIAQFTARDFAANALTFVAKLGPARAGLEREVRSEFSSAEVGAQLLADALRRIAKGGAGGA
jgi:colanic acid/amylovoran biosynthesis protein